MAPIESGELTKVCEGLGSLLCKSNLPVGLHLARCTLLRCGALTGIPHGAAPHNPSAPAVSCPTPLSPAQPRPARPCPLPSPSSYAGGTGCNCAVFEGWQRQPAGIRGHICCCERHCAVSESRGGRPGWQRGEGERGGSGALRRTRHAACAHLRHGANTQLACLGAGPGCRAVVSRMGTDATQAIIGALPPPPCIATAAAAAAAPACRWQLQARQRRAVLALQPGAAHHHLTGRPAVLTRRHTGQR